MPITKEQFDAAAAANPGVEIAVLAHDKLPDEILVRMPDPKAWGEYRDLQTEGKRMQAAYQLVLACTLEPDAVGLAKMLNAHPGLTEVWAGELNEMAGVTRGAYRKKF